MLLAFTCSVAMDALLSGGVGVALPNLMGTFGVSFDEVSWVSTFYLMAAAVITPLSHWLAELFGRRNYFIGSTALFLLASLGCALSPSFSILLVCRALQGAGAAAFRARAMLAITTEMPATYLIEALVLFTMGLSVAGGVGVAGGGWLGEFVTWRLIFLMPVPLGILGLGSLLLGLEPKDDHRPLPHVDWRGFLLLANGLIALQWLLSRGEREEWFLSPHLTLLAACSAILLPWFLWWQLQPKNPHPLLNLRLLRDRNLLSGLGLALLLGLFINGGLFVLPQFLRAVGAHDGWATGKLLLVDVFGQWCALMLATVLAGRISPRILLGVGALCFSTAMACLCGRWTSGIPDEALYLPLFLRGASLGFFIIPLGAWCVRSLPREHIGEGRALYYFSRHLGGSLGVALLTLLADRRESFHSAHLGQAIQNWSGSLGGLRSLLWRETQTLAYQDVFVALFGFGILALLLILAWKPKN